MAQTIVEYEAQIDQYDEQEAIKEALSLVPDMSFAGIDFDGALEIKKIKLEQDIKELQRQLGLLELL